jgi:hypothetical protein
MFVVQALTVAQAPNCYIPESPRVCQVVNAAPAVALPPTVPDAPVPLAATEGAGLGRLAALGALPLLIPLFFLGGGDGDNDGGTSPIIPPEPIPAPIVFPGLLLGAGFLWAARRNRATLMAFPLLFVPLAGSPDAKLAQAPGPQELSFPVISDNTMTVNYGGRSVNLPVPMNMPRDTSRYRYYTQNTDGGNNWQVCWEEIKPQVCPPVRATPRRLLW